MAAALKALNAKIRSNPYTDYFCSTHFWGPASNFGIPLAAVMDTTTKDPDIISGTMTAALVGYSGVFMRYSMAVTPKNYLLFGCHFVNFGAQLTQAYRYTNYWYMADTAAAALYLAAKPSGHTVHPRQLLTAFTYLHSVYPDFRSAADGTLDPQWQLPEGQYEVARDRLYEIEAQILRVLGFQTHVALPYSLCINYLQTLDVFQHDRPTGSRLARRAFKHLNGALLSPQLLYLTHQPPSLATAAIYLAARELDVKLPEGEWWEVFDVDREELGFLVVALQSLEGFVREDRREWGRRKVPLTAEGLRSELERRRMLEEGL